MSDIKHCVFLILYSIFSCTNCSLANGNGYDTINWNSNIKLKFSDFKSNPNPLSNASAESSLEILCKTNLKEKTCIVLSNFSRSESWIKPKNNNTLLLHEQVHFNIAEIFARKLRAKISEYVFIRKTLLIDIKSLYDTQNSELDIVQDLYDKETNFSNNYKCQEEWNRYINQMLKELEAYSNPIVKLHIKEE